MVQSFMQRIICTVCILCFFAVTFYPLISQLLIREHTSIQALYKDVNTRAEQAQLTLSARSKQEAGIERTKEQENVDESLCRRGLAYVIDPSDSEGSGGSNDVSGRIQHVVIDPQNPLPVSDTAFNIYDQEWKSSYERGVKIWRQLQDAQRTLREDECPSLQPMWDLLRSRGSNFEEAFYRQCADGGLLNNLDQDMAQSKRPRGNQICISAGYEYCTLQTNRGVPDYLSNNFYYSNWFSPGSRIIVASNNVGRISPQAFFHKPGVEAPKYYSMAIQDWLKAPHRWSEAVFGIWSDVCRRARKPLSALEYVAQVDIINQATNQAIYEIIRTDPRARLGDRYVQREYGTSDPDFYALVGSPNGYGVAELLAKFAASFATSDGTTEVVKVKTIKAVNFVLEWSDNLMPNLDIAFGLEDIDPPSGLHI